MLRAKRRGERVSRTRRRQAARPPSSLPRRTSIPFVRVSVASTFRVSYHSMQSLFADTVGWVGIKTRRSAGRNTRCRSAAARSRLFRRRCNQFLPLDAFDNQDLQRNGFYEPHSTIFSGICTPTQPAFNTIKSLQRKTALLIDFG